MRTIVCPACDFEQQRHDSLLGRLGRLIWFRCRACGADFADEVHVLAECEEDEE